jgi:hypothetical protein
MELSECLLPLQVEVFPVRAEPDKIVRAGILPRQSSQPEDMTASIHGCRHFRLLLERVGLNGLS